MGEVALVASDVDVGLRERLDAEINAFNAAATGYPDGGLLCITAREDGGDLCRGAVSLGARRPSQVRPGHPADGRRRATSPPPRLRSGGLEYPLLSGARFLRPPRLRGMRSHARLPRGHDQIHLVKQLR
jgi:hypothetical protein